MSTLAPTALAARAAAVAAELGGEAPHLLPAFRAALPRATEVVARRLVEALHREGLATETPSTVVTGRHGFGRVVTALTDEAGRVLAEAHTRLGSATLTEELTDAVAYLALAYARNAGHRATGPDAATGGARAAGDAVGIAAARTPDEQSVYFEQLATEGHNLHPCARTRLGWSVADVLAHDLESGRTAVEFLAVRRELHIGEDVGRLLGVEGPSGYAVQPVHAWQSGRVLRRYADLVAARALVPLEGVRRTATPTAALRTLLLDPTGSRSGPGAERWYLKLSLDIQVTSTRRTISVASTRNGPALSALLARLFADDPAAGRLLLLAEVAGAAADTGAGARDLAAILRQGLAGRLGAGEVAVPGSGLYAVSPASGATVVAELVTRYAATRGVPDGPGAALAFVGEYARLLLPPLLRLVTRYGIALEAHLQNCIPTFVGGVPHRLALRDCAGLRLHRPRLSASGLSVMLWPGSVVGTDDADVMRAKLAYTALQAHLGEVVARLVGSHALDEAAAWRSVRAVVDEVYDELHRDPQARVRQWAADDHAFWTAPTLPHKALVRMRLAGRGDVYVPVPNSLR